MLRKLPHAGRGNSCRRDRDDSLSVASKRAENSGATMRHVHSRHRRREIVRMSVIPPPHTEGYASYLAAMDEQPQLPALELLKSLDDLDEEEDEDDEDD